MKSARRLVSKPPVSPEPEPEVELPEQATGKEYEVLMVRASGNAVLDAGDNGGMFVATGDVEVSKGDTVRVSFDKTDANGYPVDAKITSVK